jgi:hypothetical protein
MMQRCETRESLATRTATDPGRNPKQSLPACLRPLAAQAQRRAKLPGRLLHTATVMA